MFLSFCLISEIEESWRNHVRIDLKLDEAVLVESLNITGLAYIQSVSRMCEFVYLDIYVSKETG